MKKALWTYLFLHFALSSLATGNQRSYETMRISEPIDVDGQLNEEVWKQGNVATDFISLEPVPGEKPIQPTEVRIFYDDEAIYVGAYLKDVSKDSVLRELTERDRIGNSDWFGVVFDTYRDNINGFEFIVTAAGVQFDAKLSAFGEDGSWNAVWYSETTITDQGWYCEIKIPYSAIRFPKESVQEWNFNIVRNIRRVRQKVFWNEIDPKVNGFLTQSGKMSGIENIVSPFRLSITPYLALGLQNNQNNEPGDQNIKSISGGMDLRYGINDAFTLDLTLIPDFSQVQSDNTVLNLSQFEVKYDENRQFFTEGTELFNKADLIYFRRVGGTPIFYYDVEDMIDSSETVIDNPERQQLINALKVSGRDKKGLGIGVFNAITQNTYANISSENGNSHQLITDPLTNYNAFVLDQNLKNNSYLSLINTNVSREGNFYNANVLGTQFRFMDKNNMYGLQGSGSWSKKYGESQVPVINEEGYTFEVNLGKMSGNFNYSASTEVISDEYDRNDMGFSTLNNVVRSNVDLSYNMYDPFGNYNQGGAYLSLFYNNIYNSGAFAEFAIYQEVFLFTKKFNAYGYYIYLEPTPNHDYWETRVEDRFYLRPQNYEFSAWYSSDYRKVFAFDARLTYHTFNSDRRQVFVAFSPRLRVNDKLSFILDLSTYDFKNDIGWADETPEDIILGKRDQNTVESTLNIKYTFSNKMGLNFRLRHYWSTVAYSEYYSLQENGSILLSDYSNKDENGNDLNNINFNIFNIDMVYRWVFSPGSEVNFIWKNIIQSNEINTEVNYFQNLRNTLQQDQINSLTIKVLYYLDYLWVKKLVSQKHIRDHS